jgi:hypothetical protein
VLGIFSYGRYTSRYSFNLGQQRSPAKSWNCLNNLAPQVGLEPTTLRLTEEGLLLLSVGIACDKALYIKTFRIVWFIQFCYGLCTALTAFDAESLHFPLQCSGHRLPYALPEKLTSPWDSAAQV